VAFGERDQSGLSHYDRVREYYRTHQVAEYDVAKYFDAKTDSLTGLFYQGDRAMRESGFDPSGRFGPFSVDIINYDPVDLNSLLYRMEMDLAAIHTLLDQPQTAAMWSARAASRADRINRLMWDERAGLFLDYNFVRHERSTYRFLTAFYPLWAGIASAAQAARVAGNLPIWERPGGLATSDHITGEQWDAPFGWAPLQIIAIEGLRRYGFTEAADRLSIRFLIMITKDFAKHSTIKEKYDVEQARSDLGEGVRFGYTSNETGFGWTNAAFLVLLDDLSPAGRKALGAQCPALESKR
jgi:alpha,alpha-trehalase